MATGRVKQVTRPDPLLFVEGGFGSGLVQLGAGMGFQIYKWGGITCEAQTIKFG